MSAPRYSIDGRGQLLPESHEAARALAARRGGYCLLPSTPDLLLLVRTPAQGGSVEPPRVVLAGDLGGFPLPDLIAFLSQARWSGAIRVHTLSGERSVTLREGELRGATSDDPADRIGEVMVRLGYVDRERLEEALHDTPPSKVGRALVERGLLQAHDLFRCVTHQVSEIFHAIMLSREGTFVLLEVPAEEKAAHSVQLSTQSLLMDSIRKIDELAHYRKRIPHSRLYASAQRDADAALEEEERRVLQLADGSRTVLELGTAARLGEFDVTRVLHRLVEDGYAVLSEGPHGAEAAPELPAAVPAGATPAFGRPAVAEPARPRPSRRAPDERMVVRVFNSIFREVRDEVGKQGLEREFLEAANAALANQAATQPLLAGLSFHADGSLSEGQLLQGLHAVRDSLAGEPVAALRQALSDVMFFLLFQAGELLEAHADEDLARRVKELLATLEP